MVSVYWALLRRRRRKFVFIALIMLLYLLYHSRVFSVVIKAPKKIPEKYAETNELGQGTAVEESPRPSLRSKVRQALPLLQDLQVENMDVPSSEDFECEGSVQKGICAFNAAPFSDTSVGKSKCESIGGTCEGFLHNTGTNMFILKTRIRGRAVHAAGMIVFIKAAFVRNVDMTLEDCAPAIEKDHRDVSRTSDTACPLPNLDPYDNTVIHLLAPMPKIECPGTLVTRLENGTLTFNPQGNNIREVTYETIIRNGDFSYAVGNQGKLTREKNTVKLDHDAVRVHFNTDAGTRQTDFHIAVSPLQHVLKRGSKTPGIPLNIGIIALDSISRSHFIRKLPKVHRFLSEDLASFMFKGYGIVGDGTTAAITALLTGKSEEELPEARKNRGGRSMDEWPFVWNPLREHGYTTMWSEDGANLATFHYRLTGFNSPPVDHYLRPFWLAASQFTSDYAYMCLGSELAYKKRFRFMEGFFKSYPNTRKFFLEYFGMGHDNLNIIERIEDDFLQFLKNMKSKGYLENTMLIILADHGSRFGTIRKTIIGKLEERLPFLSITMPSWFKEKHPEFAKALQINTERLTSPRDLHMTLLNLLSYPKAPDAVANTHAQSLFHEVPTSRRCKDAHIPEHFCPCLSWSEVSTSHDHVTKLGRATMEYINKLIREEKLEEKCTVVKGYEIINAVRLTPSKDVEEFVQSADMDGRIPVKHANKTPKGMCNYQIQVRVLPYKGTYEVTGHVSNGRAHLNMPVSRLDAYGKQPHCIMYSHPDMRKFCYCQTSER